MWNDTLPVCENMGRLSPWLIYLSATLVHHPVSQQHLPGSCRAQGIAEGDGEG